MWVGMMTVTWLMRQKNWRKGMDMKSMIPIIFVNHVKTFLMKWSLMSQNDIYEDNIKDIVNYVESI